MGRTVDAASAGSISITSATTTVTLSGAPRCSASSTSASTTPVGSAARLRICRSRSGGDPAEAVAAQQVAVPGVRGPDGELWLDCVHAVQGLGQQVAPVVGEGLLLGNPPGVHQRLHVGVVLGQLGQQAVAQQVGAGIPDVDDRNLAIEPRQRRQGRPQASGLGDASTCCARGVVRLVQRRLQHGHRIGRIEIQVVALLDSGHLGHRRGAGQLAGGVAPCRRPRRGYGRRRSRSPRSRRGRAPSERAAERRWSTIGIRSAARSPCTDA